MPIISDGEIGIDHLEFCVPSTSYSLQEYLTLEPPDFSLETMQSIWKHAWFEPDVLYQYFVEQVPGLNDEPATLIDGEIEEFKRKSGIDRVYCASAETSSDMAVKVGRRILDREPGLARKIDVVIYYHSTLNEEPTASTSGRLQYELGLKNALTFSVSQKSGNASLMALKVACEMMTAEADLRTFLLVGSEKFVPPYNRIFGTMTIMGDSASAMIVRRPSRRCRPLSFSIYDFPEPWNPHTDSESFGRFLADKAGFLLNQTLDELHIGWSEITLVIPSSLNLSFIQLLSTELRIPWKKIYSKNISRYGYLTTSDLVVNLASALSEGHVNSDDIALILNLGLDHSLGCAVLQV